MLWVTMAKALQQSRQVTSVALPLSTKVVTPLIPVNVKLPLTRVIVIKCK